MSYILEALRKAERERNPAQSEPPRVEPRTRFAQISKLQQFRPYRPVLVAGLCFSLMIAMVITLLTHHRKPAAVPLAEALQTTAPAQVAAAQVPAGYDASMTLSQMYADGNSPATLDDLIDTGAEPSSDDVVPYNEADAAPAIEAAAVPATSANNANNAADEAANTAPAEPPARPTPVTSVERVQLDPAPAPQIPKLSNMPADYRAAFPLISLDVHSYDSAPQKRFIMIAGKRYNEGDTLREGPHIVQIVPEGVIFEFRGEQTLFTIAH